MTQIEAALRAAQQHAAQQTAQINDLTARAQVAEQRAQAAEAVGRPVQPPPPPPTERGTNRVIDTRVLGKPNDFSGEPGTWRDWSTVFRAYASACTPELAGLMERAEGSEEPVLNATLEDNEEALSSQLYYMLVMINKGLSLDRVISAGVNEGLEAWRTLVRFHEPQSRTRAAGLLQELLSFDFDGDVPSKLIAFDRAVKRYEQAVGSEFPDTIKVGVLVRSLKEGPLRHHLLLNSQRLETWELVKAEVENLRRAQIATGSTTTGVAPMDIDSLAKQIAAIAFKGKGKGQAGSRGKGAADHLPSKPCPICGKTGPWKQDCWYAQHPEGGGKTKDQKGKGRDSKCKGSAGKGKTSGTTEPCWT